MKLQELKEMHFKKLAGDTFGYAQTWATWTVEGEATITIYLVEGNTALIQFSSMNDSTGRENNKWLTRKVKDGAIQFNGKSYLVSYPENKVEEVTEEAPVVKEFSIYRKNDVHIVSAPQGEFALTIGGMFNVDYKDEHGEYFIENLLFMGSGPANDCLLFKNERGDILHMDPLKVQRVTIPFPFKTEREKNEADLEEPIDGLVSERPYQALLQMAIKQSGKHVPVEQVAVLIDKNNLERYLRALSHLEVMWYHHKEFGADHIEIIHDAIEEPFEEEAERMLMKKRNEVDLFKRYHELLMKSLERGALTAEERVEMVDLQEELNLKDRSRLYQLHKAAFGPKEGVQ